MFKELDNRDQADRTCLVLEVDQLTPLPLCEKIAQDCGVDVGSTTADLIPFADKPVLACDYNDHQRLVNQTLIYTGVARAPLMAITDKVPFAGEWYI
jgi:uncharacterized hydantoinase/oxoprolinase family protein